MTEQLNNNCFWYGQGESQEGNGVGGGVKTHGRRTRFGMGEDHELLNGQEEERHIRILVDSQTQ